MADKRAVDPSHATRDLIAEVDSLTKAVIWSGGALVVGALIGLALGINVGRKIERAS